MYCPKCKTLNEKGSIFCHACGIELDSTITTIKDNSYVTRIDKNTPPFPYVISSWKFVILSLATFSLYDLYWFYRQWKTVSAINGLRYRTIRIMIYSVFSPLTSYSLFKNISKILKEENKDIGIESGALSIMYFIVCRFYLGFLVLLSVQSKINLFFETKYKDKLVRSKFGLSNWLVIIVFWIVILIFANYEETPNTETSALNGPNTSTITSYDQNEIISSVVNIYCPSSIEGGDISGGTGTIITEDGVILTNSHIIPQNKSYITVPDSGCLVTLPDPVSGQPLEVYYAKPIVIPDLSEQYDLAYVSIYSAYYDETEQKYWGTYPKKFPAFDDTNRCTNENLKLGESIRIFGYPAISGGFSLTVTDGLISSFPGDGLIITSAKISNGNSGGLAIDKNGCMIGVPSMVSTDENESLGVIYSMELVNKFSEEVSNYLNQN